METLNKSTVAELKKLMGDDCQDVYVAFNKSAQQCIQNMNQAIKNLEIKKIEQASHTLKGSSANIGAMQLSKLCEHIVYMARNSDSDGYAEQLDKIVEEYNKLKVEVAALFQD